MRNLVLLSMFATSMLLSGIPPAEQLPAAELATSAATQSRLVVFEAFTRST